MRIATTMFSSEQRFCGTRAGRLLRSTVLASVTLLALGACSADPTTSTSRRNGAGAAGADAFGNVPVGTGGTGTGTGTGFGNPTGTAPTGLQKMRVTPTMDSGEDFSHIWIANTTQGTMSKLDTRTMVELGRYKTSANGMGLPSRTSVAPDGNVAVANRTNASGMIGGEGGIMKVYALQKDCKDKNGNGTIDTSTGAMDIKPFMEDECVAWFTPMTYWSNRPLAWAAKSGDPDGGLKLWTSATLPQGGVGCDPINCSIDVLRLNGDTGAIEDKITVSGLTGTDFLSAIIPFAGVAITNYGGYGGASDSGGNFWVFVSNTSQLVRVDAVTLDYRIWPVEPMSNGYGITIDENGRVFICGAKGLSRFDPSTQTWMTSQGGPVLGANGCMTDGNGKIWVGGGSDMGDPGLHSYDAETMQPLASWPVGGVKGVSIDADGYVWGVGSAGALAGLNPALNTAWRVDPLTGAAQQYDGLNGAYSYSDMTGFGLKHAGVRVPPLE